jgi:hypothetical protein
MICSHVAAFVVGCLVGAFALLVYMSRSEGPSWEDWQ